MVVVFSYFYFFFFLFEKCSIKDGPSQEMFSKILRFFFSPPRAAQASLRMRCSKRCVSCGAAVFVLGPIVRVAFAFFDSTTKADFTFCTSGLRRCQPCQLVRFFSRTDVGTAVTILANFSATAFAQFLYRFLSFPSTNIALQDNQHEQADILN
jgi:hypothetical protein